MTAKLTHQDVTQFGSCEVGEERDEDVPGFLVVRDAFGP